MTARDMSLRDWFAGQVIAGLFSNSQTMVAILQKATEKNIINHQDIYAEIAYNVADAMIAERAKIKS